MIKRKTHNNYGFFFLYKLTIRLTIKSKSAIIHTEYSKRKMNEKLPSCRNIILGADKSINRSEANSTGINVFQVLEKKPTFFFVLLIMYVPPFLYLYLLSYKNLNSHITMLSRSYRGVFIR